MSAADREDGQRDGRPFSARVIGGGPGSPPVIEVKIDLAPLHTLGNVPAMRLRIPFRHAVSLHAQLGRAIERAHAWRRVPEGGDE